MFSLFQTPIEYLKGVGNKKANILKKDAEIFNFQDLLLYFPYKYVDKSKFYLIREIPQNSQAYIQIKGCITELHIVGEMRKRRLIATFKDSSGSMELLWFNGITYMEKYLKLNKEYVIFGKPQVFGHRFSMIHPEISLKETAEKLEINSLFQAFYNTSEKMKHSGLDSKNIGKLCLQLLKDHGKEIKENLPDYILKSCRLISRQDALFNIHFPKSEIMLQKSLYRLKFNEMFFLQIQLLKSKIVKNTKNSGFIMPKIGSNFNNCYNNLPYPLTNAQKKVIREMRSDLISGKQMNRLLQGDVGSGKTITALLVMLIAIDNGFQTCMMAPTEILAEQHYLNICKSLNNNNNNLRMELLTGSTKMSKRKKILEDLKNGEISILIGTHALIEDNVIFASLGLTVIDEQHRFGVEQRAKLWKKNTPPPHILVMTATPIPRTLSMTVYGDLDVSIIDELPKNRKPIETHHFNQKNWSNVIPFLKEQIRQGRQIFVVFPLIQESETLDLQNLMKGYENFKIDFPEPNYHVSCVHGQMSSEEKNKEMEKFASKQTDILLATSVIEVGIDIPNANVMIIENAERFGLSQLHQLRGRVGRGKEQSFCILLSGDKLTSDSKRRIQAMVETNNGFELANFDLKMRGPGDLAGTRQSGMIEFRLFDLVKDEKMISYCRDVAKSVLADDPELQKEKNTEIKNYLSDKQSNNLKYFQIS